MGRLFSGTVWDGTGCISEPQYRVDPWSNAVERGGLRAGHDTGAKHVGVRAAVGERGGQQLLDLGLLRGVVEAAAAVRISTLPSIG
jgi:hypothetical protein